jgi:hypothetical protein
MHRVSEVERHGRSRRVTFTTFFDLYQSCRSFHVQRYANECGKPQRERLIDWDCARIRRKPHETSIGSLTERTADDDR